MNKRNETKELTVLPMAMAFCRARRALRPFLRHRPTFLAVLVVTMDRMAGYFESACEVLLKGKLTYGVYRFEDSVTIRIINSGKSAQDAIVGTAQSGDRSVVLIFTDEAAVPDEYRVAADVFEVISEFDDRSVMGAIYRVCKMTVSEAEAKFLRQFPIERLTAVFRRGRTVNRALSLLRHDHAARKPSALATSTDKDEPIGIEELFGFGEAKSWGLQLLGDLKLFTQGKLAWRDVDPGLLLSGPTGTGKTRFAMSLAQSSGYPLIQASAAQWQAAGHLGDMLKAMRKSFSLAADCAPSILLIDEIDSLGDRNRLRGDNADYTRQVINAALECLDGVLDRPGVIAIGATNYPDLVDGALLRPGRMDHHIRIELPDEDARLAILGQRLGISVDGDVGSRVAELTDGWTGAQLGKLSRKARRVARQAGRELTKEDVIEAMPKMVTLSEERLFDTAIHECGHAIVGASFGIEIQQIRISTRYLEDVDSVSLGSVTFKHAEGVRRTKGHYLNAICVLLAGMAAEVEVFGDHSDGAAGTAGSDLVLATRYATMIECSFGMGYTLISEISDDRELEIQRLRDGALWTRINSLLHEQMERTRSIIRANRAVLDDLTSTIIARKRMNGDEVSAFFNDRDFSIDHNGRHVGPVRGSSL